MSEWSDLRYFLAVTRTGTLAGAARELKVEATTVGRRLVALEQSLGARLFDRTPDGMALTIAGERIVEHARAIEAQMAEVERKAAGEDAKLEGTVRLATSENLAVGFLLRVLAPIHARHPGMILEVQTGAQPADLHKREADLAVRVGPNMRPTQPSLIAKKLVSVGMALYASESYLARHGVPREGGDLEGHVVCAYGGEIAGIPPAQWLVDHGGKGRVAFRTNSMLGLAQAVASGVGLCVLPCFIADPLPEVRRVRERPLLSTDVWLVVHPDLQKTARVRAVIDFLEEAMDLHGAALRGDG